jgi:hypothetical protein
MHVAVFARYPSPGKAKTRLIAAIGPDRAAAVHRQLVERTIVAVRASGLPFTLYFTGADAAAFEEWLGPLALQPQADGDLGERLARVPAPALLIGSDCPDLSAEHLRSAAQALAGGIPCIGPAEDGGYWLLGLPTPRPDLFEHIEWGTGNVYAATLTRLGDALILPTLADLDRPEDLARWPGLMT